MNYIKRLEEQNKSLKSEISEATQAIQEFRTFLLSSKFQGYDLDGTRKDWISTIDVEARLAYIQAMLPSSLGES